MGSEALGPVSRWLVLSWWLTVLLITVGLAVMTKDEYDKAIEEIEALIDKDPLAGSAELKRLETLAIHAEKYEEDHFPIDLPSPQDLAEFRADQMDVKEAPTKE